MQGGRNQAEQLLQLAQGPFIPIRKATRLARSIALFSQYHLKYPSHGYRWLNAKIKLDTGIVNSAPYAHKCC